MTAELDYASPRPHRRLPGGARALPASALVGYFLVSIVTLPFLDAVWVFGELPVLALVQLPKTGAAGWVRTEVVMAAMRSLGLSSNSFSPDYVVARPYALAIVYAGVLAAALAALWWRTRFERPYRWWAVALVVVAAVDFFATLRLADGPRVSVY